MPNIVFILCSYIALVTVISGRITEADTVCENGESVTVSATSSTNKACKAVRRGLQSVKVSKSDADKLERELQGGFFETWNDKSEVMNAKKIPFEKMSSYLDHMQNAYEGIDENLRKKMEGMLFTEELWEYKIVEWRFNKADNSGARYGMIAFDRSPDGKYVDCMYVLYKLDFKIAPEVIIHSETKRKYWGLKKKKKYYIEYRPRNLGMISANVLKNFFRLKALQRFQRDGLISSINYVPSLNEVPDTADT